MALDQSTLRHQEFVRRWERANTSSARALVAAKAHDHFRAKEIGTAFGSPAAVYREFWAMVVRKYQSRGERAG